jgi:hypothetical protein
LFFVDSAARSGGPALTGADQKLIAGICRIYVTPGFGFQKSPCREA